MPIHVPFECFKGSNAPRRPERRRDEAMAGVLAHGEEEGPLVGISALTGSRAGAQIIGIFVEKETTAAIDLSQPRAARNPSQPNPSLGRPCPALRREPAAALSNDVERKSIAAQSLPRTPQPSPEERASSGAAQRRGEDVQGEERVRETPSTTTPEIGRASCRERVSR